jgi:anti-sigma B factor antagonist
MKATLKTRKVDGIVVMDISGRLCAGQPTMLLHETVRKFIEDGDNNFLINLADVSLIDTSGLGELVSIYSLADSRGGAAKLLHLGKKAKDVLQMTKLLTVFDTFVDEVQAINSFEKQTAATAQREFTESRGQLDCSGQPSRVFCPTANKSPASLYTHPEKVLFPDDGITKEISRRTMQCPHPRCCRISLSGR